MKNYNAALWMLAALPLIAACSDDTDYDNPSGETYIYEISVANGGFTGADKIAGELNEEAKTISFTVPAETDIQAVKFTTKLSLGASLDQESYDVSTGSADITVVNNLNSSVYRATFNLLEPTENPIVRTVTAIDADGAVKTGFVSDLTSTVYLNCEGSATAKIESVGMLPRRSTYTLTNVDANGNVSADDPGQIKLDFMGLTSVYDISFSGVPTFGADFSEAVVYDYSATANIWAGFEAEDTRWSQFDGENLLIVNRNGATIPMPHIVKWDEVAAGSPVAHYLDVTGVEGGTHVVSAGGVSNGHFYVCNLSTGLSETSPLKVYYWDGMDAICQTVLSFPGNDDMKGRWGDNMSVTLDENGDGYIWFIAHADGSIAQRFAVSGYTNVAEAPETITCPYSVAYYASINPVIGEPGVYTMTSTYQQTILLVDADLNVLNHIDPVEGFEFPVKGDNDARVVSYNGERYLVATNCFGWVYQKAQELHVYDISDGGSSVMAFSSFNEGERTQLYAYSLSGGKGSAAS
ncbi:MAG: DUF4623 domain-containing protein, partial [Roseburia sp.]|nr:DUF4623 domain-containing protein [Roseburia sp.]